MSFIYLASPYSHPDPAVVQLRFEATRDFTAELLKQKKWVYSPIIHCHDLANLHKLPTDFAYWQEYNQSMLCMATSMLVLCLLGWEQSKGVQAEIAYAKSLYIPTQYAKETFTCA